MARQCLAYDESIEKLRVQQYPMLKDSIYLDHAGSTLCAKSVMDAFARDMTTNLYGNPHSASASSQLCSSRIDDTRLRLLSFFNADPSEYDLVFTANATAAVKLVVEAMRSLPRGYAYIYHQACHTSLVGAREDAVQSVCADDDAMDQMLAGESLFGDRAADASASLVAYSAQSHMDGRRYPLTWAQDLKEHASRQFSPLYTLLDAASFSATSRLDLSSAAFAADFVILSLYKIFGFPDLGALIVRRSAEQIFDSRRYFGGGTVDAVTCSKEDQWHSRKAQALHERLEDGTLPFHSIIALDSAMKTHQTIFGEMSQVHAHVSFLTRKLYDGLQRLQHGTNSLPVCALYSVAPGSAGPLGTGPIVSFNVKNSLGGWVSLAEFEKLAVLRNVHIRTGGLCSPARVAIALNHEPWEVKRNLANGASCAAGGDSLGGKPTGVIRASLGAMSTRSDVDRFLAFIQEYFVEDQPIFSCSGAPKSITTNLHVQSVTVYPIKSCGGFAVPPGARWEVRPEGLSWDREWCLVHRGSGHVLSQKRYPKMALLRPVLDIENGLLRVSFAGFTRSQESQASELQIPLSASPSLLDLRSKSLPSQVCGESISAQAYISQEINAFFSCALDVPCVLARFPPGGRGVFSRTAKARIQKYQRTDTWQTLPGSFPDIPSPPDFDNEQVEAVRVLLSNESPILLINNSSVRLLNEEIIRKGRQGVPCDSFRANIVIEETHEDGTLCHDSAYAEDLWNRIRIGELDFKLLGSCQRCQMVCVDQQTGQRRQEPFSTLAKTRRFDGKVFFGAHMQHEVRLKGSGQASPLPSIQVGDAVIIQEWLS